MKSVRGALVTGSDPPFVHTGYTAAGDVRRASNQGVDKTFLAAGVYKTEAKTLDRSPADKKLKFEQI